MGVPFYYTYLQKRYDRDGQYVTSKYNTERLKESFTRKKVLSLSLDLNGIIHNEAQRVYKYGKHETNDQDEITKLKNTPPNKLEESLMAAIVTAIYNLIQLVTPNGELLHTLIIGIDGPVPYAKLYQQKQRRYKAKGKVISEKNDDEYIEMEVKSPDNAIFDSNCITPGTEFMEKLNDYMKEWLETNQEILAYRIIYSSHRVPGEGEHKIMHYLRTLNFPDKIPGSPPVTHVVHGLDADLIMLGILSPLKYFTLMREDTDEDGNKVFNLVDVNKLREKITMENIKLKDYVLLTFLAGNDFLPSFPSISIGRYNTDKDGIGKLINIYLETGKQLVNDNNKIIWENLRDFFKNFAKYEEGLLNVYLNDPPLSKPVAIFQSMDVKKSSKKVGGLRINMESFIKNYYDRAFTNKSTRRVLNETGCFVEMDTISMAEEWLGSISWVIKYYTEGIKSINVSWSYRYNYAPLGITVLNALNKLDNNPIFEWNAINYRGNLLKPYAQLVSVLPPSSIQLVPEQLHDLILNEKSDIADLIPRKFLTDMSGKGKEHEAVALIPFIDGERVTKAVSRVKGVMNDVRNTFEDDVFYKNYKL